MLEPPTTTANALLPASLETEMTMENKEEDASRFVCLSMRDEEKRESCPTVTFYNISYTVGNGRKQKTLLDNISGICRGNEITAIMGATGAGKTSLLDVLAGRKDGSHVKGHCYLIDGDDHNTVSTGYCQQDDILYGTLTVRENLSFSANLRLPNTFTAGMKRDRVESVISDLALSKCADSRVGTEFFRGISGGEKKRANIGMELVVGPSIIFLDEPTTGLDATTAGMVMSILCRLRSKGGKTIIMSIHQPRFSIFNRFDWLILLSEGRIVYQGLAASALDYFQRVGYANHKLNNPADFLLDVLDDDAAQYYNTSTSAFKHEDSATSKGFTGHGIKGKPLVKCYEESAEWLAIEHELKVLQHACLAIKGTSYMATNQALTQFPTTFWQQCVVLGRRNFLNMIRNPFTSIGQWMVTVGFSLLVGGVYYHLDQGPLGLQNRVGAFFFVVMAFLFSNLTILQLFIEERRIFLCEKASHFYRVSSYFFARTFCYLVPLHLIPCVIFSAIAYHLVGFRKGPDHFLIFLVTNLLTSLSSASLCLLISSAVGVFDVANLTASVCYVFMMLTGGLLINFWQLPKWVLPLKYLSIFQYALETLSINEFHGATFDCTPANMKGHAHDGGGVGNIASSCQFSGDLFLESQQWYPSHLPYNLLALALMFVGYMTLAYLCLLRLRKQ